MFCANLSRVNLTFQEKNQIRLDSKVVIRIENIIKFFEQIITLKCLFNFRKRRTLVMLRTSGNFKYVETFSFTI